MCNRYILFAVSTVLALWLAFQVPSELISYWSSFVFGFLGRWDLAMRHAQSATSTIENVGDLESIGDDTYTTFLMRVGEVHEMLGEYEEAIDTYLNKVVPRLREEVGVNDLEIGIVLSDVADIYRRKGDYQKGLEFLAEAQRVYFAGSGEGKSMLLKINEESVKDMKELINVAKDQESYVATFVQMARRWHFTSRSHDAEAGDTCPSMDQCRRKDRFYVPHEVMFFPSLIAILWIPVRFLWDKPSRFRFVLAVTVSAPVLLVAMGYWGWVAESYTEKLNTLSMLYRKLGDGKRALKILDEARCSILANPHEETLLITDTALDTFMGALFTYSKLGDNDMVDELVEDINRLMEANAILEPSFLVLGYYSYLFEHYLSREEVEKAEQFAELAEAEAKDLSRVISITAEEEVMKILESKPVRPLNTSSEADLEEEDDTDEKAADTSIKVGYI